MGQDCTHFSVHCLQCINFWFLDFDPLFECTVPYGTFWLTIIFIFYSSLWCYERLVSFTPVTLSTRFIHALILSTLVILVFCVPVYTIFYFFGCSKSVEVSWTQCCLILALAWIKSVGKQNLTVLALSYIWRLPNFDLKNDRQKRGCFVELSVDFISNLLSLCANPEQSSFRHNQI